MQTDEVIRMIYREREIIRLAYADLWKLMYTRKRTADYVHGRIRIQDFFLMPHRDEFILHAPGECEQCDEHEDWQLDRIRLRVAFTGHRPGEGAWGMTRPDPWSLTRRDDGDED